MNSIRFPDMFVGNSTGVVTGRQASVQDLKLLFGSEKGEFKGDPFFGLLIKKYMYEQNSYFLKDVIIDEIFSQIKAFAPHLQVNRSDIKISQERTKLTAKIKCINKIDFKPDMYELVLFKEEER